MVTAEAAIEQGMADSVATLDETLKRFGVAPSASSASAIQRRRRSLALNQI
jgi:hypothetical protein